VLYAQDVGALEDKIVQAAVAAFLTPIYEVEFLGFSYGFRPERGQHDALDALAYGLGKRRINWVLDADIRSLSRLHGAAGFFALGRAWSIPDVGGSGAAAARPRARLVC
jgi:hypothetical protein